MLFRSFHSLFAVAFMLLLASSQTGCQSHLAPRDLTPEFLAPHGAGRQQIELRGMSSFGGVSTAVGPSDLLEVSIVTGLASDDAKPVQVRIGNDGSVDIPYVGPVIVTGLEPTAVGDRIAETAIERGVYRRPQVNVIVAEQATNRVTVLGAVNEPGVQEVPRNACDILSAIASAGGFTDEAGTVVEVLRHGSNGLAANHPVPLPEPDSEANDSGVQPVAFNAPVLNGGASSHSEQIDLANFGSQPQVRQRLDDRDVVVVRPREKRVIHISGLVRKPDQFELTENHDLRVLDAIAMAGGVTTIVADKVIVIRQSPYHPAPVVVQVSISQAKKDGAENLLLQSGDMISVEPTATTAVVGVFKDLFRVSMGIGSNLTLF